MRLSLALLGLVAMAAAGLFFGMPLVAAAAGLLAMLWVAAYRYGQLASAAILAEHRLDRSAVRPGERVTITLALTNPLRWPLPLVDWEDDFPDSFELVNERHVSLSSRPHRIRLFGQAALGHEERIRRRVTVRPTRRGRHVLGPVDLTLRDPLGLIEWAVEREAPAVLTVFPSLYPVPADLWRPVRFRGQRRGPPWNPPDPSRILGVRPYEPGDPPRLIHPYATARTGTLQVKRLETEAEDVVELVVLVATAPHIWYGIEVDRLEALVSAVASCVDLYLSQGAAVGLTLAGSVYGHPRGLSIRPGRGTEHYDRLMTALAWAQPGGGEAGDLPVGLARLAARLRPGTPVLVFTTFFDESWGTAVEKVRRLGRVTWVACAFRGRRPEIPGVPVYPWTPGGLRERLS